MTDTNTKNLIHTIDAENHSGPKDVGPRASIAVGVANSEKTKTRPSNGESFGDNKPDPDARLGASTNQTRQGSNSSALSHAHKRSQMPSRDRPSALIPSPDPGPGPKPGPKRIKDSVPISMLMDECDNVIDNLAANGANPFDANPFDANPFDANPFDANPVDAKPFDATLCYEESTSLETSSSIESPSVVKEAIAANSTVIVDATLTTSTEGHQSGALATLE